MILGRKRESLDGDGKKGSQVRSDWEFGDGNRNAFASREREYTEATEKLWEISSCHYLTARPGLAWKIVATSEKKICRAVYLYRVAAAMPNRDAVILTNGGTGNVEVERMMSAADDDLKERPKERGQAAGEPVCCWGGMAATS